MAVRNLDFSLFYHSSHCTLHKDILANLFLVFMSIAKNERKKFKYQNFNSAQKFFCNFDDCSKTPATWCDYTCTENNF